MYRFLYISLLCFAIVDADTSELYEDLYRHGYHANQNLSHAHNVLRAIPDTTPNVLDVGCSHGYAVAQLWNRGIEANGIDISPTAVRMATRIRAADEKGKCGGRACFSVGSASDIPFANNTFHTLISTDVLEHILPQDIDRAVTEMIRVTQAQMWLKIATMKEANTAPLKDAHKRNRFHEVTHLHTTIMSLNKWKEAFERNPNVQKVNIVQNLLHLTLSDVKT